MKNFARANKFIYLFTVFCVHSALCYFYILASLYPNCIKYHHAEKRIMGFTMLYNKVTQPYLLGRSDQAVHKLTCITKKLYISL